MIARNTDPVRAGNRGTSLSPTHPAFNRVGCFLAAKRIARLTFKKGTDGTSIASLFAEIRAQGGFIVPVWATWEVWA